MQFTLRSLRRKCRWIEMFTCTAVALHSDAQLAEDPARSQFNGSGCPERTAQSDFCKSYVTWFESVFWFASNVTCVIQPRMYTVKNKNLMSDKYVIHVVTSELQYFWIAKTHFLNVPLAFSKPYTQITKLKLHSQNPWLVLLYQTIASELCYLYPKPNSVFR